jgi:protein O-mannosyl-transferase
VTIDGPPPRSATASAFKQQELHRLQILEGLGLAEKVWTHTWRLSPQLETLPAWRWSIVLDVRRLFAGRGREAIAVAVPVVAALAVSTSCLANGFVWDDRFAILRNPWIRELQRLPEAFTRDLAGFVPGYTTSYYRPLMHVIYALAHAVFGFRAWGFHLVNVLVHAAVTACVAALALRRPEGAEPPDASPPHADTIAPATGAIVGATLFAVTPLHADAVAWLGGITDLSAALFGILSILAACGPRGSGRTRLVIAPLLLLAAMLCKEPAIMIAPVVLATASRAATWPSAPRAAISATPCSPSPS